MNPVELALYESGKKINTHASEIFSQYLALLDVTNTLLREAANYNALFPTQFGITNENPISLSSDYYDLGAILRIPVTNETDHRRRDSIELFTAKSLARALLLANGWLLLLLESPDQEERMIHAVANRIIVKDNLLIRLEDYRVFENSVNQALAKIAPGLIRHRKEEVVLEIAPDHWEQFKIFIVAALLIKGDCFATFQQNIITLYRNIFSSSGRHFADARWGRITTDYSVEITITHPYLVAAVHQALACLQ